MVNKQSIQVLRKNGEPTEVELNNLLPGQPLYDLKNNKLYMGGGTLNPINQEEINKNYYNLGAYDTYVSNGDGTVTVTRKTGYLKLDGSENWKAWTTSNSTKFRWRFESGITDSKTDATNTINCKANTKVVTTDQTWSLVDGFSFYNKNFYFYLAEYSSQSDRDAFLTYLSKNPIYVQYELANSYTEQVIENQPIRPANQEENYYWHEEWKKGLNLIDPAIIKKDTGIDANTGDYFTISNFNSTEKIRVTAGAQYTANGISAFAYAPNGDYLRVLYTNNNFENTISTFTCPSDTGYIAFTRKSDTDIMVVKGDYPYPYEPYCGEILREKDIEKIDLDINTLTNQALMKDAGEFKIRPFISNGGNAWFYLGTTRTGNSTDNWASITFIGGFGEWVENLKNPTQFTMATRDGCSVRGFTYQSISSKLKFLFTRNIDNEQLIDIFIYTALFADVIGYLIYSAGSMVTVPDNIVSKAPTESQLANKLEFAMDIIPITNLLNKDSGGTVTGDIVINRIDSKLNGLQFQYNGTNIGKLIPDNTSQLSLQLPSGAFLNVAGGLKEYDSRVITQNTLFNVISHKYQHNITLFSSSKEVIHLSIINGVSTAYSQVSDVREAIGSLGFNSSSQVLPVSGGWDVTSDVIPIIGLYISGTNFTIQYHTTGVINTINVTPMSCNDTVVQIV